MDDVAKLVTEYYEGQDSEGNPNIRRYAVEVFCKVRSVSRYEYYRAAEQNLRPDIVMTISHRIDYNGEKMVIYDGKIYDVLRSYWSGDEVEITLSERIGDTMERYATLEMPDGFILLMPDEYRLKIKYI